MKSGRTPFFAMTMFLLLGLVVVPSRAWALPTQAVFDVFFVQEDVEQPAGVMLFDFDSELSNNRCLYAYEWISDSDTFPLSAEGFVSEVQTADRDSCIENSSTSFQTIIHVDSSFFPPSGFNRFGQLLPIKNLVLRESDEGLLTGVIQFEGEEGASHLVVRPSQT